MKIKVWGNYGLFTHPETKSEPYSYPVITPTAAVGLLESIYWRPEIYYRVNSAMVLNTIAYVPMLINNVSDRVAFNRIRKWSNQEAKDGFSAQESRTQRLHKVLSNPAYVLDFDIEPRIDHIDITQDRAKFRKRVDYGKCFQQPFFGCKEFMAYFEWASDSEQPVKTLLGQRINLGLMPAYIYFVPSSKNSRCVSKSFSVDTREFKYTRGFYSVDYKIQELVDGIVQY